MSAHRVLAVAISSLALIAAAAPSARAHQSQASAVVPNSLDLAVRHIDKDIVDERSAAMRGIKYGAEGGEVLRDKSGLYHWFTSEQYGDPYWVANRIAHWTSADGLHWHRDPRWVKEGNHDTTGTRDRSNYFDPRLAYDQRTGYWYMFYVGYRYSTDPTAWHLAKIYRAKAVNPGLAGLSGPYHDQDGDDVEVMGPVAHPGPYEATRVGNSNYGLGADSVTVYPVGDHWVMIYAENMLATAPNPSGTFTRLPEGPGDPLGYGTKPMTFDPKAQPFHPERFWLENPIVTRVPDGMPGAGTYLMAVGNFVDVRITPKDKGYAFGHRPLCGWATSPDGIRWSKVKPLDLGLGDCMTVNSLLPGPDGTFIMYVTAHTKNTPNFERLSRVQLAVRKH